MALAELVISLLILEVTVVATHRAIAQARAVLSDAVQREHALSEAEAIVDSLGWSGYAGPGTRRGAWGRVEWSGGGNPAEVTIGLFAPGQIVPHTQIVAIVTVGRGGT